MFGIFFKNSKKEIEELNQEIKNLQSEYIKLQKEKDLEIEKLKKQLLSKDEEIQKMSEEREVERKTFKIKEKQMDILEKNLKNLHKSNTMLKEDEKTLKDSALDANLPVERHKYKIPLEKYFNGTKFKGIVSSLKERSIDFICELDDSILEYLKTTQETKIIEEFLKKYNDYLNGDLDIEMKIHALKGEKIGKIYPKLRKFNAYVDNNSLEYMNDLLEFNFYLLLEEGFKNEQIKDFSERAKEYFEKNLIKERE